MREWHYYEVNVNNKETYMVTARNEDEAKVLALDYFWDDDEWINFDPEHTLTKNNCEIMFMFY